MRQSLAQPVCLMCAVPLTGENLSEEHIFPSALGGRKVSERALCGPCNNRAGHTWDSALAEETKLWRVLSQARPGRGSPDYRVSLGRDAEGRLQSLSSDGSVKEQGRRATQNIVVQPNGEKRLVITAPDERSFRKAVQSAQRKDASVDVDAFLTNIVTINEFVSGYIEQEFSAFLSDAAMRSVLKTAMVFAAERGIGADEMPDAVEAIRRPDAALPMGRLWTIDPVVGRDPIKPIHRVILAGQPERRLLLAVVELFGSYRYGVVLSRCWHRLRFLTPYAIDPATGKQVSTLVDPDALYRVDVDALLEDGYWRDGPWRRAATTMLDELNVQRVEGDVLRTLSTLRQRVRQQLGVPEDQAVPTWRRGEFEMHLRREIARTFQQFGTFGRHLQLLNAAGRWRRIQQSWNTLSP